MAGSAGAPSAGLRVIEHDGIQVLEWRIEQRELAALDARQKDEAAGLIFNEAAQHAAFVERELIILHANVAQEDHIIFGQRLEGAREFLNVVLVPTAGFVEARME